MENKFQNKTIEGINIYRDKKGQTIYLDPFTKNGYVITPQKEKTFKTLSNVLLYTVLVGIFLYVLFEFSALITIAAMAIIGAFLEWRFRKFLNNCTIVRSFKPEKKHDVFETGQSDSIIILKAVLYIVLGVLLAITNIFSNNSDKTLVAITYAVVIVCIYFGTKYISVIFARNRNRNHI